MDSKRIHFMGILGSGASATAAIAKAQGFTVSGCDTSKYSEYGKELSEIGIQIVFEHDPNHIKNYDMVVVSPAISHYDSENPELLAARELKIPILTWQQFSAAFLQKDKFVIAICGTHGKSTTTAMTAKVFENAGLDPTVQLGAIVSAWQKNYRVGKSKYYIIEADEYGDNFLAYQPDIIAVTNIEYDHPEFFATDKDFYKAFENFFTKLKPNGKILIQNRTDGVQYPASSQNVPLQDLDLIIPGQFNLENASLALACAKSVGIAEDKIRAVLTAYTGLYRRFSLAGEVNDVKIFDDYGHHPTAITKTAKMAREKFQQNRILLIFQPHMFTRTKALFEGFVSAFQSISVDTAYVVDIFPSREHDTGIVSSKDLVAAVNKPNVHYGGSLDTMLTTLMQTIKPGDIVINMGAGDIITLSQRLLQKERAK